MTIGLRNKGSVFLMAVFAVALLSMLVSGMLQINTEELQLMQNQIFAAQALATAEAGLNDAFGEIRVDPNWSTGFTDEAFEGGSYMVDVNGLTITSTGTSPQNYVARVEADITIGSTSPYVIRIDNFRINE
jgi:type II secretory pathway component PulK